MHYFILVASPLGSRAGSFQKIALNHPKIIIKLTKNFEFPRSLASNKKTMLLYFWDKTIPKILSSLWYFQQQATLLKTYIHHKKKLYFSFNCLFQCPKMKTSNVIFVTVYIWIKTALQFYLKFILIWSVFSQNNIVNLKEFAVLYPTFSQVRIT